MRDQFGPGREFQSVEERDRAVCNLIDDDVPLYEIEEKFDLAFRTVEKIDRDYKNDNASFQEA